MSDSHLDINRLEKVRQTGSKITARCPACAADGGDRKGDHLAIFPSGKYVCVAMQGDAGHRRRIFALAGVVGANVRDPEQDRLWKENRAKEARATKDRKQLIAVVRAKRIEVINHHLWPLDDVWQDSPQRIDCPLVEGDPRHFLDSLYQPDALLWTGTTYESGQDGRYAKHWRTCREWQSAPDGERVGPMVAPGIWKPGVQSRSAPNVESMPYVVLDFDGFDGIKPETPEQLQEHLRASLALTRWIREGLHWRLAAILWTGGKSLHSWFHSPAQEVLESLKASAPALGIDANLIGNPEHPCRLPGHIHEKTGNKSRLLWLQEAQF
jgi:hypothetical protein